MKELILYKNPIEYIIENAAKIVPHIDKTIGVYNFKTTHSPIVIINQKGCVSPIENQINTTLLTELRNQKEGFKWLKPEDIPFFIEKQKNNHSIDLFTEIENVVLLLLLKNELDKKSDLVYFYFNKQSSNFGLNKRNNPLTGDEKHIIGELVYSNVKLQIDFFNQNKSLITNGNKLVQSIVDQINNINQNYEKEKEENRKTILELCKKHLDELTVFYGISFILSPTAFNKILQTKDLHIQLREIIKKAVENALYVNIGKDLSSIVIEEYYIQTSVVENTTKAINHPILSGENKYVKTIFLLDKLEDSAKKLIERNESLTSAKVGFNLTTPISAPAITDALKKHGNKISFLLNKHPDKWLVIRNEFKPLINLISSRVEKNEEVA